MLLPVSCHVGTKMNFKVVCRALAGLLFGAVLSAAASVSSVLAGELVLKTGIVAQGNLGCQLPTEMTLFVSYRN